MIGSKKDKFDFICSLGGNCMVSAQLKQRNLRMFSLPFDWLYMIDDKVLYNLPNCFRNKFADFIQKENMRYVPLSEIPQTTHTDRVLYQDMKTQYYFLNHFNKKIDESSEYDIFRKKMTKRINRFFSCINNSKKILFLLSHSFYISNQPYIDIYNTLKQLYPDKEFFIKVIQFNSDEPSFRSNDEKIEIDRYKRKDNLYDFIKTNIEWEFLDNIKCDFTKLGNNVFISIYKIKKGLSIVFFPYISSLITFKMYFLGIRFIISLGKLKINREV